MQGALNAIALAGEMSFMDKQALWERQRVMCEELSESNLYYFAGKLWMLGRKGVAGIARAVDAVARLQRPAAGI
jgi:hypothetical protein